MFKLHFNENIETVETYDANDYDRTSVPIAELNDAEFNEIECYRLEMKKQTIEEYQKRWRKSRNSNNSVDSPDSETNSNNSGSDSENLSPSLKSCLINKNSSDSNKLNASAINAAMSVSLSSSLEDDPNYFREGQAQPNIILNTPHSSDYNSDEGRVPKVTLELSSSLESNLETNQKNNIFLFSEPDQENDDSEGKKSYLHPNQVSPLSFNGTDSPTSDNDADGEESDDDNHSFIRLFGDSFEAKDTDEEDSDYIKDMSLTEGENSISLSHHILSGDIPTTSFNSSTHRLFTDSLFTSSPILPKADLEVKHNKDSQVQEELDELEIELEEEVKRSKLKIENEKEEEKEQESREEHEEKYEKIENSKLQDENEEFELEDDFKNLQSQDELIETPEEEIIVLEEEEEEDDDDLEIDKHPHSDTYVNYGNSQHIDIKPRRHDINNEIDTISSCPFGKPISFLDDLPETFQTPLSSSLPSKSETNKPSNSFFGSPFSPKTKSPYKTSSYSSNSSSLYSNRLNRYSTSSSHSNGSYSGNSDGSYLVSKRNYLSIGNRDKPKSYTSSNQHRLSHYTTSKWEGIGNSNSYRSNKSGSNSSYSNNSSNSNKYYPRPATKLVTTSPFSSSWIYDASF
jgi:hypothetical protein